MGANAMGCQITCKVFSCTVYSLILDAAYMVFTIGVIYDYNG